MPLVEEYKADKKFIDTIFWVLELPVFVLLLAFVYMVSGQILSMETVEIAMLKSRGFSKKQIVSMNRSIPPSALFFSISVT